MHWVHYQMKYPPQNNKGWITFWTCVKNYGLCHNYIIMPPKEIIIQQKKFVPKLYIGQSHNNMTTLPNEIFTSNEDSWTKLSAFVMTWIQKKFVPKLSIGHSHNIQQKKFVPKLYIGQSHNNMTILPNEIFTSNKDSWTKLSAFVMTWIQNLYQNFPLVTVIIAWPLYLMKYSPQLKEVGSNFRVFSWHNTVSNKQNLYQNFILARVIIA